MKPVESSRQDPPISPAEESLSVSIGFENSYARLPERFHARVNPTSVAAPRLVMLNVGLAESLGIDPKALASPAGVGILSGNLIAEGSEPLAMAYAGHQFGNFVPQLGDGRANLLGEVKGYDLQLKGAGPTPFSRRGDGRAALGPVLREYVVSEAMAALGVPTTRALAAVTTGERVVRETMLPGAVLTRVAASHLRVGTFQYFAARGDTEGVRVLAEYAMRRHYPAAVGSAKPIRALLDGVIGRQAELVAQWMMLGFIHGVMNTDNTSISGETIDYGPCAFMEAYDPGAVYSAIDRGGRYAFKNQPGIMLWNLTRLAECLLPLMAEEEDGEEAGLEAAKAALAGFQPRYEAARLTGLRKKMGLTTERDGDGSMGEDLLARMAANGADFTLTFRRLCEAAEGDDAGVRGQFADAGAFDEWAVTWRERMGQEPEEARGAAMRRVNPIYIPRNHLMEAAIQAGLQEDWGPFEKLVKVTLRPFEEQVGWERYAAPARVEERVLQTFCGT